MKAYQLTGYNTEAKLNSAEITRPTAGAGQVLVKVAAVGLNPLDNMISRGEFKQLISYKLPITAGNEFAGIIVELGAGVTNYSVGDEVFARPNIDTLGAFAEYVAVDVADIARKPQNLTMTEAASLPLVLLTAIQAFTEKSQVGPGTKVFIQGGTGGLGSVAIQVAKQLGATVATTVSTKNVETAKALGADVVVDYRTQRYEDFVSGYDVVLDTLGKDETSRSMGVLRPGGTLITVVGNPEKSFARQLGKPFLAPVMQLLSRKERKAAKQADVDYKFLFMRASGEQLESYRPLIEEGKIKPLIGETFTFDRLPEALALMASGKSKPGKTVVSVAD